LEDGVRERKRGKKREGGGKEDEKKKGEMESFSLFFIHFAVTSFWLF
jgi:hypothetical protein